MALNSMRDMDNNPIYCSPNNNLGKSKQINPIITITKSKKTTFYRNNIFGMPKAIMNIIMAQLLDSLQNKIPNVR